MNEISIDACWNRIGVFGDKSCPELPVHIRCLNCNVFHGAAASLLDRPSPEEYLDFWTERIALPRQEQRKGTVSAVLFRIGAEWLALPAKIFAEVAEMRPIHSLPHRQEGLVLGLTAIRGELLLCVSLPRLLGSEAAVSAQPAAALGAHSAYERMLVIGRGRERVAFPVDEVHAGVRYHPDDLRPVPATIAQAASPFTIGLLSWEERNVGVLDEALLFYSLGRQLS